MGVLFHHVGPGDQTEVLRLGRHRLYPRTHLVSLPSTFQILGTRDWGACAENEGVKSLVLTLSTL